MPDGVTVTGGKLVFGRALRRNDSGVYECVVKNSVGVGKTEYTLTVAGKRCRGPQDRYSARDHTGFKMRKPLDPLLSIVLLVLQNEEIGSWVFGIMF